MAFQELFTIIYDGETQHPRVHYVFSDDEEPTHLMLNEDPDHRIIIVDYDKVKAESLSPDWQAVKAELTQAPSWGDQAASGLMLKITGKEARPIAGETIGELIEVFDRGMEVLEEVLQDGITQDEVSQGEPFIDSAQHGDTS